LYVLNVCLIVCVKMFVFKCVSNRVCLIAFVQLHKNQGTEKYVFVYMRLSAERQVKKYFFF